MNIGDRENPNSKDGNVEANEMRAAKSTVYELGTEKSAGAKLFSNALQFCGAKLFTKLRINLFVKLLIFALIFAPLFRLPEPFSVTALDVGQGDCTVIRNGSAVYMIDGGSSSESEVGKYRILPYLKSQGIGEIDAVFLTHDDADHIGAVMEMLEMRARGGPNIVICSLVIPHWLAATQEGSEAISLAESAGAEVHFMQRGDIITDGSLEMKALSPEEGDGLTGNEGSLVLSAEYKNFKALFTGDMGQEGERRLLGTFWRYDYLKAAHHGSRNSSCEEFLREISPKICTISAPESSVYGHPHRETTKRLEEAGARWLQTGKCGAVRAEVSGGKMRVRTYRSERIF